MPIEKVAADLRRLRAQLEARENRPGLTGKGMRMGAVRTAYVQVLADACHQLEVQPPRSAPHWHTPLAEIYRVEAQLRERGLDVRPVSLRRLPGGLSRRSPLAVAAGAVPERRARPPRVRATIGAVRRIYFLSVRYVGGARPSGRIGVAGEELACGCLP